MPISPQTRRAAERLAAERTQRLKAEIRAHLEQIQHAVTPPLTAAELSVCFGLYAPPEGQPGGTTVGRWLSTSERSRNALPDELQRAVIDRVVHGDALLAVEAPAAPGARRTVLLCEAAEATRLGPDWTVVNLSGRPVARSEPDWDDEALFDPLAAPAPPAPAPAAPARRRPTVTPPRQTGVRPPLVRVDGRVAPRPFGRTGWTLPPIGLGAMRLSTEGRPSPAEAEAVVRAALDAGVRLIDTADVYALDDDDLGHNERLIARVLADGPDGVRVATKVGLTRPGGRWIPCGRPEHLVAAAERSVANLGVDALDLLLLHVVDRQVPLADQVGALAELQQRGLAQHVGLCNVSVEQLDEAAALVDVAAVQCAAGPFDKAATNNGVVAWCHARQVAFVAHSPAGGWRRIARTLEHPVLSELALVHDATPHQIALAWLLGLGPGVFAIPGASRPGSARGGSHALDLLLAEADLDALDHAFPHGAAIRGDTWGSASDDREVRVVMGAPASGKSSLAEPLVARGYHRLNRDELGGRLDDLLPHLERALAAGVGRVVLDNTYPTVRTRRGVLDVAARFAAPVRCTWLDTPLGEAAFNASLRMLDRFARMPEPDEIATATEANTIPPAAVFRFFQLLEPPSPEEGFSEVERVPFVRRGGGQQRALVLDMDGTLRTTNSGRIYPVDPDDIEILPGRREALEAYVDAGWVLVAVSNQSGIARGDLDTATARACFDRTVELLGVPIDVRFCPHGSGRIQCWCRKPMPGLGVELIRQFGLDRSRSVMVGDLASDREFAENCGFAFWEADAFFAPDTSHPVDTGAPGI